jgi:hypothetical protein
LSIRKHTTRNNVCFLIQHKKTKEWCEIGTNKLLSANPRRDTVNQILRDIVTSQITSFRNEVGEAYNKKVHIDHVKPFWKLVNKWMSKNGYTHDSLYTELKNGDLPLHIKQSWFKYHKKKAELQVLSVSDNLSKGGK